MPRILIADDHEIVRDGLRSLLSASSLWQVCGEAADGAQAVESVQAMHPDLVILDVSMPVMNGLEAAAAIHRLEPAVRILIFSMHNSPQLEEAALQAGAHAFVQKSAPAGELVTTMRRLLNV